MTYKNETTHFHCRYLFPCQRLLCFSRYYASVSSIILECFRKYQIRMYSRVYVCIIQNTNNSKIWKASERTFEKNNCGISFINMYIKKKKKKECMLNWTPSLPEFSWFKIRFAQFSFTNPCHICFGFGNEYRYLWSTRCVPCCGLKMLLKMSSK